MRVRMISTAAGPAGVWPAGSVQELPDEQGRMLIAIGAAEGLSPEPELEPEPVKSPAKKKGARGRR